jgi:DNA-binding transcriptional MerR regulator/effector-binding domain-containing protein
MTALLTIGEFSRMTLLSVKALRHYHEVGLLAPAAIDPATGYRFYGSAQVPTAQAIRRFRDLDMPLDEVRAVLDASDEGARTKAILMHLERMEFQLARTQATVASLRALLEDPKSPPPVSYRTVVATPALAIWERVRKVDIDSWCAEVYPELMAALGGLEPSGPGGALYENAFFEEATGEVIAFVPVVGAPPPSGRVQAFEVPAAELAIMVHRGSFSDLDQTYGALGTFVAEVGIGTAGAIREHYLVTPADTLDEAQLVTEVCWPISR